MTPISLSELSDRMWLALFGLCKNALLLVALPSAYLGRKLYHGLRRFLEFVVEYEPERPTIFSLREDR